VPASISLSGPVLRLLKLQRSGNKADGLGAYGIKQLQHKGDISPMADDRYFLGSTRLNSSD
jgi:hypothetical protein